MKRLMYALAASALIAAPLTAISTDAAAQPGRYSNWDNDRNDRGWDNRRGGRWDNDRNRGRHRGWDNRRDQRPAWRWDNRRNNGYHIGNRWYWGPPPQAYNYRRDVRPGFRPWQRGAYLPPAYRGYVVNDYYRYRLRPPPRGYQYYNTGNGDFILAAIATGLIVDIISSR